jgi:hypothetical protein
MQTFQSNSQRLNEGDVACGLDDITKSLGERGDDVSGWALYIHIGVWVLFIRGCE